MEKSIKFFIKITIIIVALVGSLIFGILGFTTIASGFAAIAKIIFYLFLIGLAIAIISNLAS